MLVNSTLYRLLTNKKDNIMSYENKTNKLGSSRVVVSKLDSLRIRLCCWWFGCQPDFENMHCHREEDYTHCVTPCMRCGADDTSYEDQVGETKHSALMNWINYWLFRKWWPAKCDDCGKRYGTHDSCIPF